MSKFKYEAVIKDVLPKQLKFVLSLRETRHQSREYGNGEQLPKSETQGEYAQDKAKELTSGQYTVNIRV